MSFSSKRRQLFDRVAKQRTRIEALGLAHLLYLQAQRTRRRFATPGTRFALRTPHAKHPLLCRAHTSDVYVFTQIFIDREYRCLDDLAEVDFIIDCGANVGYSSAYFLSRFPDAHVIAVEPDPENFAVLCENVRPYGSRCTTIMSGVWSSSVGLVVESAPLGSQHEWEVTVRTPTIGELPSVTSVDLGTLLHDSAFRRISILKIDIEGSEREVFGSNTDTWIGMVDNIVIELHGRECRSVFMNAIDGLGFDVSRCDELTVCTRPARIV